MTFEEVGLKLYVGSVEEDQMFAEWWYEIAHSGDLELLISSNAYPLGRFLALFKLPSATMYTEYQGVLKSVHWITPTGSSNTSIYLSTWFASDIRPTKYAAQIMEVVYTHIFKMKKTIIGLTKQENLLNLHRKIGYQIFGPIPDLFDDQNGYVMYLTEEMFKNGTIHKLNKRFKEKESWAVAEKVA